MQIAASLIVFSRPFNVAYLMGLALMVGGVGLYQVTNAFSQGHMLAACIPLDKPAIL